MVSCLLTMAELIFSPVANQLESNGILVLHPLKAISNTITSLIQDHIRASNSVTGTPVNTGRANLRASITDIRKPVSSAKMRTIFDWVT